MRKLPIYILFLLALVCCTANQHKHLDKAETIMDDYPDSALHILQNISKSELNSEHSHALYTLLLTQAQTKNHIFETDDSLISESANYFATTDDKYHSMLAFYYLAQVRYNAGHHALSLTAVLKAHDLANELDQPFWIAMSARMIADIYHQNYHTSEEVEFAEIELKNFLRAKRQPFINYAILDLAQTYIGAKRYGQTIAMSKQLIDSAIKYDDPGLKYEAIRLIGLTYINTHDYRQALTYFENVCKSEYATSHDSIYAGISYLRIGKVNEAIEFTSKINPFDDEINGWLRYNTYLELDSTEQAMAILNQMYNNADSILRAVMTQNLSGTLLEYHKSTSLITQEKLKFNRLVTISTIMSAIIIIGLISILFLRYKKRKIAIINHNVLIARNLRELIIENNAKSQHTIQTLLSARFTIIDNLCQTLYQSPTKSAKKRISDEVTNLIDQFSSDENKLSELISLVNLHHDKLIDKLLFDFPELKEADLKLILFSILGFSNYAISIFLNEEKITAVYDRRKRLKAKFRNSNSKNKDIFIKTIS